MATGYPESGGRFLWFTIIHLFYEGVGPSLLHPRLAHIGRRFANLIFLSHVLTSKLGIVCQVFFLKRQMKQLTACSTELLAFCLIATFVMMTIVSTSIPTWIMWSSTGKTIFHHWVWMKKMLHGRKTILLLLIPLITQHSSTWKCLLKYQTSHWIHQSLVGYKDTERPYRLHNNGFQKLFSWSPHIFFHLRSTTTSELNVLPGSRFQRAFLTFIKFTMRLT